MRTYTTLDHQQHENERYDPVSAQHGHALPRCTYPAFRRAYGLTIGDIAHLLTVDGSDAGMWSLMTLVDGGVSPRDALEMTRRAA